MSYYSDIAILCHELSVSNSISLNMTSYNKVIDSCWKIHIFLIKFTLFHLYTHVFSYLFAILSATHIFLSYIYTYIILFSPDVRINIGFVNCSYLTHDV